MKKVIVLVLTLLVCMPSFTLQADENCPEKLLISEGLSSEVRYRCAQGVDEDRDKAIDKALNNLAKSIWTNVDSHTIKKIFVGEDKAVKEEFIQQLSAQAKADLYTTKLFVTKVGNEYVATAAMDIVVAASAYIENLVPLSVAINQSLGDSFETKSDVEKFRIYQANLEPLKDFERVGVVAQIIISLNKNPQMDKQFIKPQIIYKQAFDFLESFNHEVLTDPVLAALVIQWQLSEQVIENTLVCPVFADGGRRLPSIHPLPATLAAELKSTVTDSKRQGYLIGRASLAQDYHRVEVSLVNPLIGSRVVASIKLQLPEQDWQQVNARSTTDNSRVLLKIEQHFVDESGEPLIVKQLTGTLVTEHLAELLPKPPQWVEYEPCLAASMFDKSQLALHHNADYLLNVVSRTTKNKTKIDNGSGIVNLSYAIADIDVSLSDASQNAKDICYHGTGRMPSYVDDNNNLLRGAVSRALKGIGEKGLSCQQ